MESFTAVSSAVHFARLLLANFDELLARDQRVGNFPKGGQDSLLVLQPGSVARGFGSGGIVRPAGLLRTAGRLPSAAIPHALAPPSVKADNSGLTFPRNAVSPILGKNSATDSPTCALAERKSCSASRTSGRRSSNEEGNPAGMAGSIIRVSSEVGRSIGPGLRPNKMHS